MRSDSSRPPGRLHIFLQLLLLPTLLQPISASLTIVQIEPFDPSHRQESHHILYSFESASSSYLPSGGSKSTHTGHPHSHNRAHKEGVRHYGLTRADRITTTPSPITSSASPLSPDQNSGDSWTQSALALLLLPFLCATGLVGNAFVCVAIATDRRLQNVTNYFLFSLALADLLVCCVVMPLSILVEIKKGQWEWSFYLCLLYVYADVFLCSASIVHMSVISLDRYLGISQPLKTRNRTKTAIVIKIALVWVITILISCPIVVLGFKSHDNVLKEKQCLVHNRHYMIYGSTFAFLIPFIIMTVTYFKTTALLNKQAMLLQQSNGNGTKSGLRRAAPPRKLGYSLRRSSGGASTPTISIVNNHSNQKWSSSTTTGVSLHNINGVAQTPIRSKRSLPPSIWQKNGANGENNPASDTLSDEIDVRPRRQKPSRITRWTTRTSSYLSLIVARVQKKSSYASNMELLSEHKATRVLAVVFICFFFCWTPFFIANFLTGFVGPEELRIPAWANTLFLWMGYVSSTINPLIYTVFNKRFRTAFIRILRGRCFSKRSADNTYIGPNSHWSRTHTIMPDNCTYSNYEQRPYRENESMIRPTGGGNNSAMGRRTSNASPLTSGNGVNGITPRKKDSHPNGRSVAFDNRQWSPSSSSTSTTIRKESAAGTQSRTPSLRKTSRITQSTTRTNTDEEMEEEPDEVLCQSANTAVDRDEERIPLVSRGDRRGHSSTEEEVNEEERKDEEVVDDVNDCPPSTSSDSPPIPSGCVRVTVSEVDLPRKKQSFILLSSPALRRSFTNSAILESPTRLIPTASDCLVAHPLVALGASRSASLLSSPVHIARGVLCSSENNLLSMGSGKGERGTSCAVNHDESDDDSEASTTSSTQTSIGGCITPSPQRRDTNTFTTSSSSSSSRDNGPALTLVGSNGHGKVFKETFL